MYYLNNSFTQTKKPKENTKNLLESDDENPQQNTDFTNIDYKAQAEKYDLKQAAHPRACIFTFLFKAASILWFSL